MEYIFWLDSMMVLPTTKLAFALPDFQKLIEYIFLARFYDGLTYDKIGLCPSWFSKIDGVLFFWLDSMMVWPTTKLAFPFQFFKNWWSTFFLARFCDGLTYDKIGLCPSSCSKIDGVHFFGWILWWTDLRQNWPLLFLIFKNWWSTFFWLVYMLF